MKKFLIWILVLISLMLLLIRYSPKATELFLGIKQKSGLNIQSNPSEALVFLNNIEVGKTPYEDKNLEPKEYLIKLEKDGASWQGKLKTVPQTVAIINRDLAVDQASSSGEILTLDRGRGMTVISNPQDAQIEIGGKVLGKTPISVNIAAGEHTIVLSHSNFLKRSIRASLPDGFNLTISVDLALSEADLTVISSPVITQTAEVKVLQTPTGFLRVRDKASLSGKEIAQVKPGDSLILLEVQEGWDRVRLPDGKEGFVSSSYVEKKNP